MSYHIPSVTNFHRLAVLGSATPENDTLQRNHAPWFHHIALHDVDFIRNYLSNDHFLPGGIPALELDNYEWYTRVAVPSNILSFSNFARSIIERLDRFGRMLLHEMDLL